MFLKVQTIMLRYMEARFGWLRRYDVKIIYIPSPALLTQPCCLGASVCLPTGSLYDYIYYLLFENTHIEKSKVTPLKFWIIREKKGR